MFSYIFILFAVAGFAESCISDIFQMLFPIAAGRSGASRGKYILLRKI
jgi:hypothetical protein